MVAKLVTTSRFRQVSFVERTNRGIRELRKPPEPNSKQLKIYMSQGFLFLAYAVSPAPAPVAIGPARVNIRDIPSSDHNGGDDIGQSGQNEMGAPVSSQLND